jgi:hypothetical protein
MMPMRRWTLALVATVAFGQEAVPFLEERTNPWKPSWELTLRADKLSDPVSASEGFQRLGTQLRLRWNWGWEAFRLVAGTGSAMGSDGNQFNSPRWDQQPSNGTQVDVANGAYSWISERTFGTLRLGLQENALIAPQALWDADLRYLGAGGSMGVRGEAGVLQEGSFRMAMGRVRNILGGRGDLVAGQLVLKVDTGPWSWTGHAGRWNYSWDPGEERLRHLPTFGPFERQRMVLNAGGLSTKWNAVVPVEARWFRSQNRESLETSEEFQITAGSRERVYWPELSLTWQRLSSTGTLYPLNGDEWWFYRRARGPRCDVSLPLPGQWVASLVYLRQKFDGENYWVTRNMLVLVKRF